MTRNIALVMSDVAPDGRFQRPAVAGPLEGAKLGAAIGAMAPIVVASTIGTAGQVLASELLATGHSRGILFTTIPRGNSAPTAADAVLEIGPPRVSLASKSTGQWWPAGDWSPDFRLRVVVDVTLDELVPPSTQASAPPVAGPRPG